MSDKPTITLTFTPDELAGIYFMTQLGIISSALNSRIKTVKLNDESVDYGKAYLDEYSDYKDTMFQIKNMGGVEEGFAKLDEIRSALNEAYNNATESKVE